MAKYIKVGESFLEINSDKSTEQLREEHQVYLMRLPIKVLSGLYNYHLSLPEFWSYIDWGMIYNKINNEETYEWAKWICGESKEEKKDRIEKRRKQQKKYRESEKGKESQRRRKWKLRGVIPPNGDWGLVWQMLEDQNYKCKICGVKESELNNKLDLDHDHGTGEPRGFICSNCNIGLGQFKDNIDSLNNAIAYLKGE